MKKLFYFLTFCCFLALTSCDKSNTIDISDSDVEALQAYATQAESYIPIADMIEGNISAVFNTSSFINPCGADIQVNNLDNPTEAQAILASILTEMGFESARELHNWMVDAGKILYDLKVEYKDNFDSDYEMVGEIACIVAPDITTRNADNQCKKDKLNTLFAGTLAAGENYGTRLALGNRVELSESQCSARGSSLNKIWRYVAESSDCR
jgi:hypothetical protein